ncbi:hypothetical protein TIFTF001_051979, partial [Ficus carica]
MVDDGNDVSRGTTGQRVHGALAGSEVKGIFRREASEHIAPCSGRAAATIHVIFGPEILLEDDNNALFVDGGLICVQRLHPGCGRKKKHTFLSGGQKHLPLANRSFLRISSSMIKVAMAASLSWPLTASSIAGEIFAHEDQVLWCWKSASGGVFKDMLALNLIMIDLPCLAPESWEVSSGVMRDHLRRSKKLAPESHKISFKVMR